MTCWLDGLHVHHLSDLLSDQGRPFTRAQWDAFFDGINPNPRYQEWKNALHDDLDNIRHQTRNLLTHTTTTLPNDGWVAIVPSDQSEIRYARKTTSAGNAPTYMLLWLDQSQRPHETGQRTTPRVNDTITTVETWLDASSDSEEDDDESTLPIDIKVPAIMGPSTSTYPRDIGWHLPTEKPET
ncbi:MAG: hypothetical protein GY822_10970, partial [Deltaproteobacteria bacterium]|nr:hypothetical protein [Deltaproteobacteria bacterium]